MKQLLTLFFLLITFCTGLRSQNSLTFQTVYSPIDDDSLKITTCRFYISNIQLLNNNQSVYSDKHPRLIDLSEINEVRLTLGDDVKFDEIRFGLGIDSITNSEARIEGDLDPVNGMYWTWNSGFINFKLEGTYNHTAFEYHIGGYRSPLNCYREIRQSITHSSGIIFQLHLLELLRNLPANFPHTINSPSQSAKDFTELIISAFKYQSE